jgi:hypothetical protein
MACRCDADWRFGRGVSLACPFDRIYEVLNERQRTNMKRQLTALLFCFWLCVAASAAQLQDVYPNSLRGTQAHELGSVLLSLMPFAGATQIGWDWQSDSPIQWQDGYTQNPGATRSYRNGMVRINVMGQFSSVLRKRTDELGWTVTLYTDGPAKFGPQAISVQPGLPSGGQCFGTLYEGCTFDPLPSLKQAGVGTKMLCAFDESGRPTTSNGNFTRTYVLSAPGKAPALFQWMESEGSGGASTTVTLLLRSTPTQACKPENP